MEVNPSLNEARMWLQTAEDYLGQRNSAGAFTAFQTAEALGADPDQCSGGRWLAAMLAGDFEAAWRESDALRARGAEDAHRFWNGEPLTGKRVIVRCLHGFGDAVQMLRYAPLLQEIAASVIYEVAPRMVLLAGLFRGVEQVITWGDDAPAKLPVWDVQLEIMELPYLFRTTLADLPLGQRYLEISPALVDRARAAMGERARLRVGVVWAGGGWNPARSLPFALLEPLWNLTSVEFWNLQGAGSAGDADGSPLRDAMAMVGDGLPALAATIANLDLVITVDTLAAHLAGAMGKPAWLLLRHAADWRWMIDREDSAWYPSLRLFRQTEEGDWAGVIARVREALALIA